MFCDGAKSIADEKTMTDRHRQQSFVDDKRKHIHVQRKTLKRQAQTAVSELYADTVNDEFKARESEWWI
ncbi:hypothetical protein KIN20_019581 [Parelaphostrongylus tenuis]|uniref:Uncharacterized protein n=1 Tax=Parelaphostrongylus tenuis TaxID=148309 RepID=A0AAD5QQ88_PARTN|nr:hypothetical protein KIN20_019581 [Parelaphostrongylus tenuis]